MKISWKLLKNKKPSFKNKKEKKNVKIRKKK